LIFVLAGNYNSAKKWAIAQMLADDEWFCTMDLDELKRASNFHVIILESASELPSTFFERLYTLAQSRGRINRT
jgi:hypothetical protein